MQLSIRNLSKRYANGVQALDNVSLDIAPGMFGLLGPNGAGKSTLMRTLATLQEADSGTVKLDDIDVLREKDRVRRVLGYLPQEFGVYPKVAAWEMLDHFARLKGLTDSKQRKATVDALLERTNLAAVRKQRLRFHNLLAEIGADVIVILSTHIVDDVADLCPRFAVISKGRLLLTGEPRESIAALRGRVWQRVVERDAVAALKQSGLPIISTRLTEGRTVVRAYA